MEDTGDSEPDLLPGRWKAMETENDIDDCMRIHDLPTPTIAQVRAACVGGGFMGANMCDLMMATTGAEVLIAPRVLGFREAREMTFTGERIAAGEAHMPGMVNRRARP